MNAENPFFSVLLFYTKILFATDGFISAVKLDINLLIELHLFFNWQICNKIYIDIAKRTKTLKVSTVDSQRLHLNRDLTTVEQLLSRYDEFKYI